MHHVGAASVGGNRYDSVRRQWLHARDRTLAAGRSCVAAVGRAGSNLLLRCACGGGFGKRLRCYQSGAAGWLAGRWSAVFDADRRCSDSNLQPRHCNLCAEPLWWGVPLLLAGAGIAIGASLRGALADVLDVAVSQVSLHQVGLAVIALGAALCARGVDLPSVGSHALDAAWLAIACHALCRALLLRCAEAVGSGAGTQRLDCLGGVIHRMPMTTGACLAGLFTIAVLPPGLGFAAFWLVFQSLVSAARIGSLGLGLLVAAVALVTGVSAGLAALAAMRVATIVFLGRPRTPRAAAADEVARPVQLILVGLAALLALLGMFPVLALLPTFGWGGGATATSLFGLRTGPQTPGYAATFIAVFVASVWIALSKVIRRPRLGRREPDWSGGFSPPPAWMPFGDPTTQCGPTSFVAPIQDLIARLPSTDVVRQRLACWWDQLLRAIAARMPT
jgi:hydrogenase-4 component B